MSNMYLELLIVLLAGFGTTLLGLFTYIKNPNSATHRLFLAFTFTLSVYNLINYLANHPTNATQVFIYVKLIISLAALINLFFFYLVSAFPSSKINLSRRKSLLTSAATLIIILLAQFNLIFTSVTTSGTSSDSTPGPAMPLFLLHTIGFLGFGFLKLFRRSRKAEGAERNQFRFLFSGSILMFTAILITNLFFVILFNSTDFISLLPLYTFAFVVFISYAIIKHKFLDIGLLVFRAVSFTLVSLFIVAVYAFLLLSVVKLFEGQYQTAANISVVIILIYTFNPLKRFIEKITKNIFYKESYSSEDVLEQLGEILRSTIALDTLTKNSLTILTDTLHITHGAYYLTQKDKDKYRIYDTGNHRHELTSGEIETLIKAAKNSLLIFEELEESPVKMLMRDAQISVCMPLKIKQENHGMLVFGGKASGEIYNQQDIDVLEIFMPQISVAIHNAKSVDEIRRFNVTLKEEVQAATTDLKSANRNLKHLDKLKDEFVFIATHELKNPVTAMRGYLSMLQEGMFGHIPDKMKGPIDQLQASNQQLVDLVNDLLQIARSEAKTLNITTEDVNLCPIIDTVIENVKPLADQKNITLKHLQPVSKEIMVKTDPNRLKEIMNNLIGNAIKYSESGIITINHAIDKEFVTTSVKDQGVGISQEDQKKLFTRFYRVEEEAAKGIPGTGLGLFIVKQLIEKMHGKIWLDSVKGHGTTFSFTLPRA